MAILKDVAKIAGVSTATVSRVLNDAENVKPVTRVKVQKAIKELNFKPSRVAQRLRIRDGKKRIIGLVVPDIQNPFYVDVVRGVEELAYLKDYVVFVGNFAQDEEKEKMYLNIMKSESVDGLIVAPSNEKDDDVMKLVKDGLPIVCVDRGLSEIDVDVVLVDNRKGAFDAVEFLIQSGYKRIAYIGGLPQIPTTMQRKSGYEDALLKYGIPIDPELMRFGDSKHQSGKKLAEELLNLKNRPTALFTGNNLITLGALETIHNQKLKIPQDIAIIGFDDMYWAISLNPPLTAVRQPGYEIGKRAAEMLFQRVKEPDRKPVKLILRTELIKRESC
jgi:LacI family transcriptional regulator/LacI family repressor for deo operon, udp, cdd, tsx, nupC, and nupG